MVPQTQMRIVAVLSLAYEARCFGCVRTLPLPWRRGCSLRPRLSRLQQCRPQGAVPGRDSLVMSMAGVERRVSDGRRYVELFFCFSEFRTWYDYPEEQIWNLVIGLSRFIYPQLVVRWQQG